MGKYMLLRKRREASHHYDINDIRALQEDTLQNRLEKWNRWKCVPKGKLYNRIFAQLNDSDALRRRLIKQARKGKNYLRLTDFVSHPLYWLHVEQQEEILEELIEEFKPILSTLYGNSFTMEIIDSSVSVHNVITGIFVDVCLVFNKPNEEVFEATFDLN